MMRQWPEWYQEGTGDIRGGTTLGSKWLSKHYAVHLKLIQNIMNSNCNWNTHTKLVSKPDIMTQLHQTHTSHLAKQHLIPLLIGRCQPESKEGQSFKIWVRASAGYEKICHFLCCGWHVLLILPRASSRQTVQDPSSEPSGDEGCHAHTSCGHCLWANITWVPCALSVVIILFYVSQLRDSYEKILLLLCESEMPLSARCQNLYLIISQVTPWYNDTAPLNTY